MQQFGRQKKPLIEKIDIQKGLQIVSPYPAAYLESDRALVVSDLHLGIESKLASNGIHIPDSVLRETLESILVPAKELGCDKVYILGDLKHEYGRPKEPDWWSVKRLVQEIRGINAEPVLIRGNHDRYVSLILRDLGVECCSSFLNLDGFILTHGHKKIRVPDTSRIKAIIIGHEHPAIAFHNELGGVKERFKAFLYVPGRTRKDPPVFVLPSVNPLAYGTDVNELSSEDFLSPYLKEKKRAIAHSKPFVLEVGELLLPFPELSNLRA